MIKRFVLTMVALLAVSLSAFAQDNPLWIRHTALSPDGKTIAFTYKGDIYTVPVTGGLATQLTSHPGYDAHPVWSPDGERIAFASDRAGALNVFIMGKHGGSATRLTYNSASEVPVAFEDNNNVIYKANIRPSQEVGLFPSGVFSQLYSVPAVGGRPIMYSAITMEEPSIRNGEVLYTDRKGYEDPMRKHHTSSVTRDIWYYSPDKGYKKLSNFNGEDRNAVWIGSEQAYFYTSERDGTLNIYKQSLSGGQPQQITTFKDHPVRYMSADNRGNVTFSWNGELYYMPYGGQPNKVNVAIRADYNTPPIEYMTLRSGATSVAISPNNKEVAFVARGDVFVTSVEYATTKRITNTPQQERDVDFSPDGRKLVYSAERNGKWDLFMTELVRDDDKLFTYAKELKETQLTDSPYASFQPKFSPNGEEVAFLRDRTAIVVLNLKTKKERLVMDGKYDYSYSDGDQWFDWSPDSKWIISNFIDIGGWNNKDVAIIKADGSGEMHNLTQSGYSEGGGRFVLDGKAVAFSSDRAGYRSHGSWGAERDIYLMFLDREAYDQFLLNKEEVELKKELEKSDKKEEDKDDKKEKKDKKKEEKKKKVEPLKFELDDRDNMTVRLTRTSGTQSDYVMDPKGEKLFYIARFDDTWDLYEVNLIEKSTKRILPNVGAGSLTMGKDGSTLFVASYRGISMIKNGKPKAITFQAPFEYKREQERDYIYKHVVQQVQDKFYDVNLHGVDWKMYANNYYKFLPHINNNYDFAEMLSELLGELNASHTGARYSPSGGGQTTASLGLFYDDTYRGKGLKVTEVMPGGPLNRAQTLVKPGAIIESIDGEVIEPNQPIEKYLNGKTGRRILISVYDPSTGKRAEEIVKPISQGRESSLLYRRWVEQREEMVRKWSDGRIGYVHIQGMDSPSFRKVFKDLLGKYRHCDAVVVDTRFNGGGWLHEDLAILLSGKEYSRFTPRGRYIGSDPFAQWFKPSIVLMGEGNYSNAHGFPWVYKTLGLGKLVGAPVPGTMTAVWWERQIDPSLVFGIPQVTVSDLQGRALENVQLNPDILVYNSPEDYLKDNDVQLKAAVDELLKQTGNK